MLKIIISVLNICLVMKFASGKYRCPSIVNYQTIFKNSHFFKTLQVIWILLFIVVVHWGKIRLWTH